MTDMFIVWEAPAADDWFADNEIIALYDNIGTMVFEKVVPIAQECGRLIAN